MTLTPPPPAASRAPSLREFDENPALAEAALAFCRSRGLLLGEAKTTLDLAHAPLESIAAALRVQPDLARKQLATVVERFAAVRRQLQGRLPVTEADLEQLAELRESPGMRGEWRALEETVRERRLTGFEREIVRLLWLFDMRHDALGLEYGLDAVLEAARQSPWFAEVLGAMVQLYGVLWGRTDDWDRVASVPRGLLQRFMAELVFCFAHLDRKFERLTAELPAWRRDDKVAWRFEKGRAPVRQEAVWRDDWTPRRDAVGGDLAA